VNEREECITMSASEEQILEALPMVRRMASRYAKTPLGVEDALGVGALALVEAGDRYDADRKVPFGGFAHCRVKGAMLDAYYACRGSRGRPEAEVPCDPDTMGESVTDPAAVRPDARMDLLAGLAGLRARLRKVAIQHARGVPHLEIAQDLGVTESRVSQLLAAARCHLRAAIEVPTD
jgi:RNA polymerase sigma factor (sigma-70 family)